MSETLLRTEPIEPAQIVGKGVTISLTPPMTRYSLRARKADALERAVGLAIPTQIGACEGRVCCLGPDEWLLRMPLGTLAISAANQPVSIVDVSNRSVCLTSIVDVSDRSVCLTVAGPRAAQVLMAGCPLDLERMAVGGVRRTLFETVEIVILRTADCLFEVDVWRSFAPWLQAALEQVASDLQ